MDRYERILTISGILYQENCPIVFEKGALLKDKKLGKNLLQFQFRSIGMTEVKAVYIAITCLDVEKNTVESVVQKYIDLRVNYYDTFGDSVAIQLSDNTSRIFEIAVQKIIFSDDAATELSGKMVNYEVCKSLNELGELEAQFIREVKKRNASISNVTYPEERDGIWKCVCGALNSSENTKCGRCRINKEALFGLLDAEYLNEKNSEYLKQQEAEEISRKLQEEQRAEKKRIKKKKIIKTIRNIVIIGAILVVSYWASVLFIIPFAKYSTALNYIEKGSYDDGYRILEELGDYRDASKQILAGKYKQGVECINNKEYEQGYEILEALGNYSDAAEQIRIGRYAEAVECLENKDFAKSVELFKKVGDYSDSKDKLQEATYQYANQLMEKEDYYEALKNFKDVYGYLDSKELYRECSYNYAEYCMKTKNYKDAIYYYGRSERYSDADDKLTEAMYQYSKIHLSTSDEKTVYYIDLLCKKDYKDSKALKKELYQLKVEINVNDQPYDGSYSCSSLSKYDKWYFHIRVTNGESSKNYTLKYKLFFPDGGVEQMKRDQLYVGGVDTIFGYYSENVYLGKTGTAALKVYDSSGNLLAEKSVQIY